MLVVQTFSGDNIRFNLYAVIGWGEFMLNFDVLQPLSVYLTRKLRIICN